MRHERKYPTSHLSDSTIEQLLLLHPLGFRRAYPDRQINNVYFDTPDWRTFHENLAGISRRAKYRLRWYGTNTDQIDQAVFEIKWKESLLGYKDYHTLPELLRWEEIPQLQYEMPLLRHNGLQAVIVNSYRRAYYCSADGRYRLTVDRAMRCAPFGPYPPHFYELPPELRVIEVKYDESEDDFLDEMSQYWPLRIYRFSKYINSVIRVYGEL